jgi:hypothetical protein
LGIIGKPVKIRYGPAAVTPLFSFGIETVGKETFGKCSILLKFKEDENFNPRNTVSILRIKI